MPHLERDGTRLYCEERGSGSPPLVLIHGWTCDHTFLEPQARHFEKRHRVVSLDLRGHGRSDKPEQVYRMSGLADDVAWTCARLGIEKPVLIGHSMGGLISLVVAAEHPELPAAIVSLDSAIIPTEATSALIQSLIAGLHGPDAQAVQRQFVADAMFLPSDDAARKQKIVDAMCAAPRHVMVSAFEQLFGFDHAPVVARCRVPWLALFAQEHSDVARLRQLCPSLTVGQTVGSGHFLQLEVPEQVNAMIERFLRVAL